MGKNSKEQETAKDDVFKIGVAEHEQFDNIMDAKYLSATEFCKMISTVFRTAYADYDGCTTEIDQQGNLTVALYFTHAEPKLDPGDDRKIAVTRNLPDDNPVKNETVSLVRRRDNLLKYGDRYYLTDDGKSGLADFVVNRQIRPDGSINWNNLVADVKINSNVGMGDVVDTKVSMLDPVKLATLIYGQTDENGDYWEYGVRVMRSLPQMVSAGPMYKPDYMLAIERVSEKEVQRICNMVGISTMNGINIIH